MKRPKKLNRGHIGAINSRSWRRRWSKFKKLEKRRRALYEHLHGLNKVQRLAGISKPVSRKIVAPGVLSLSRNFEETVKFVGEIKELSEQKKPRQTYFDFRPIRHIGPAAALYLGSVLYGMYGKSPRGPRTIKFNQWSPVVVKALHEMGFFAMLKARRVKEAKYTSASTDVFLKHQTGVKVIGEKAKDLRILLQACIGNVEFSSKLFSALTEAMTNVVHHAYPIEFEYIDEEVKGRWWMAGSFEPETRQLAITFADHGVGIPVTLRKRHSHEVIRAILQALGVIGDDHAEMIEAAMELGRSQTELPYRGKGLLKNIRGLIDSRGTGSLRIFSGRGEYQYTPNSPVVLKNHEHGIQGTLLEWRMAV